MGSRWLNATIVLFWMSTMTWLFWQKVLPSLIQGEPPTYEAMLPAPDGPRTIQVGWKVFWNGQFVGTATGRTHRGKDGIVKVEHHLRLRRFPLRELIPIFEWLQAGKKHVSMDVDGQMTFDNRDRLLSFNSSVGMGNRKDRIKVTGAVDGNLLKVDLRFRGKVIASTERRLPPKSLVGGQLSPQGLLKGLRVGQHWTMPVFTFNPSETLEILHAEVERTEHITWNGLRVDTHLVVYCADPALGLGQGGEIRKKLWVRPDGVVLQQSTRLLGNWLKFVRTAPEEPEET